MTRPARARASSLMRRLAGLTFFLALSPILQGATPVAQNRSIRELGEQMTSGRITSESLVRYYLGRIDALDRKGPALHAVIAVNPDAIAAAKALDAERRDHGARGPLHGIPVLIKDNIETQDRLPTTAGSYALANNFAPRDAPVIAALRAAGAIILGKTNLSEWANFRSSHPLSGWSAVGGLTRNPYVLDRTACGSSSGSGVAVAVDMAAAAIGTETDGSVTCPAAMNGIVGLKPTVGLLSQAGIVPISHAQDTAGPMARTVADVAALLTVMVRGSDHCPPQLPACQKVDYFAALDPDALRGKRIGVLHFPDGEEPQLEVIYQRALATLRAAGATLIEVAAPDLAPISAAENTVLTDEFKTDLDQYLAATNPDVKVRSLAALIDYDRSSLYELALFGQEIFLRSEASGGIEDPAYRPALELGRRLAGAQGIDRLLVQNRLDLLVAPTATPAWRVDAVLGDPNVDASTTLPAVAGYPHLTVPMGQVEHLPVGLSFIGPAWSESLLLACGFAFQARSTALEPPDFLASIDDEILSESDSD